MESVVDEELMYSLAKNSFGVSGSQVVDNSSLSHSGGECEAWKDLGGYVFVRLDHAAEILVSLQDSCCDFDLGTIGISAAIFPVPG